MCNPPFCSIPSFAQLEFRLYLKSPGSSICAKTLDYFLTACYALFLELYPFIGTDTFLVCIGANSCDLPHCFSFHSNSVSWVSLSSFLFHRWGESWAREVKYVAHCPWAIKKLRSRRNESYQVRLSLLYTIPVWKATTIYWVCLVGKAGWALGNKTGMLLAFGEFSNWFANRNSEVWNQFRGS